MSEGTESGRPGGKALPVPVGRHVLLELEDADGPAQVGRVVSFGRDCPLCGKEDGRFGCREVAVGDRVVIDREARFYYEICPTVEDPERPVYCIVSFDDLVCVDSDGFYA